MGLSKRKRTCFLILFGIYLCILVYVLFLSPGFGRTQGIAHGVNLIPLQEIRRYYKGWESLRSSLFWLNIVGNIVAFLPMGFFISALTKRRFYAVFAFAIVYLASAGAEILQYVLRIGSFDIDDVILNTFGGILGIALYALFRTEIVGSKGRKK